MYKTDSQSLGLRLLNQMGADFLSPMSLCQQIQSTQHNIHWGSQGVFQQILKTSVILFSLIVFVSGIQINI